MEETFDAYGYCYNNPVNLVDPTGMSASTEVTDNGDGTYKVVGGKADGDTTIYVVDSKGKRIGEIGKSLTEYSFLDESGNPVLGAQIDTNDMSGINFLNQEIINNKDLTIWNYMPNATGGEIYDFKTRGVDDRPEGMSQGQFKNRGMLFQSVDGFSGDGTTTYASARDIGNVAAGYVAGNAGLPWRAGRLGFDGLQSWQEKGFATEGKPTQMAQRVGHNVGWSNFTARYESSLKSVREAKIKNPLLGPK